MLIVVEEVIAALAVGAVVYSTVLARLGGTGLAEGSGERFGREFFIGWRRRRRRGLGRCPFGWGNAGYVSGRPLEV
jgi:hypothetical protein